MTDERGSEVGGASSGAEGPADEEATAVTAGPDLIKLVVGENELWWLRSGQGAHGASPLPAAAVVASLENSFRFVEETPMARGLRSPQLGALHAILAERSKEMADPITVVMPTGSGKTETMLAVFCNRPNRTLVIVPSDALRLQTVRNSRRLECSLRLTP